MTTYARDASIYVQVAFKAAADLAVARGGDLADEQFATDFAVGTELLFAKIAEKSEGLDYEAPRGNGGGYNKGGGKPQGSYQRQQQATPASVAAAFPGSTEVPAGGVQTVDEKTGAPIDPMGPLPEWLFAAAAEAGVQLVVDHRDKLQRNPKFPHFKAYESGKGFWPPK